jgi:hypothetical protein
MRHLATLWNTDRRAARAFAHESLAAADELIRDLIVAFELTARGGWRDAAQAREAGAWRRAVGLLDGGVFAGLTSTMMWRGEQSA